MLSEKIGRLRWIWHVFTRKLRYYETRRRRRLKLKSLNQIEEDTKKLGHETGITQSIGRNERSS